MPDERKQRAAWRVLRDLGLLLLVLLAVIGGIGRFYGLHLFDGSLLHFVLGMFGGGLRN